LKQKRERSRPLKKLTKAAASALAKALLNQTCPICNAVLGHETCRSSADV